MRYKAFLTVLVNISNFFFDVLIYNEHIPQDIPFPKAYVYFYLIAILALRVKSHFLQERNVLGNIRQKQHLNLICFVSFKNQNCEMYCLLSTAFRLVTTISFQSGQISHTQYFGEQRDWGRGA